MSNPQQNNPEDEDYLMSTSQIADMFEVTTQTVRTWLKRELMPSVVLPGGIRRVWRKDVIAFANRKYNSRL